MLYNQTGQNSLSKTGVYPQDPTQVSMTADVETMTGNRLDPQPGKMPKTYLWHVPVDCSMHQHKYKVIRLTLECNLITQVQFIGSVQYDQ